MFIILGMKKKFVYSLSQNGIAFYVGCTGDIYKRYTQHLTIDYGTPTSERIKEMINNNTFPDIKILYYLPEGEAKIKEGQIINAITLCGFPLTNIPHNRTGCYQHRLGTPKTKIEALSIAKYIQDEYLFIHANRNEAGEQISFTVPIKPILSK